MRCVEGEGEVIHDGDVNEELRFADDVQYGVHVHRPARRTQGLRGALRNVKLRGLHNTNLRRKLLNHFTVGSC